MSSTLQGLIEAQMSGVFGSDMVDNPKFAKAMATAIQTYLNSNVKVNPGQVTAGGPTAQATVTPGTLNAS